MAKCGARTANNTRDGERSSPEHALETFMNHPSPSSRSSHPSPYVPRTMARAPPSPSPPWSDPKVVLVGHQLELVSKLERDLASCKSSAEKAIVCRQTRDSLLDDQENLEILSAICRDVMEGSEQDCTSYKHDRLWRQFTQLATKGARLRATRAKALQTVADRWGAQVLHHYGWGPTSHIYCQQLHAAAKEMDWPTFVRRLNRALLDRHWAKSLHVRPIPGSINPITPADIMKTREEARCNGVRLSKAKSPVTEQGPDAGHEAAKYESESHYRAANKLPANLGLDRFGVIVRKEFDNPPTNLVLAGQDGDRETTAPSAARNIASDRLPFDGHGGQVYAEAARLMPHANENSSPFPPSPPSSPDARMTPAVSSTADSVRGPLPNISHRKRAAPLAVRPVTKRRLIRPPALNAAADAQEIYGMSNAPFAEKPLLTV